MFIQAYDEDIFSAHDHLDNIIINEKLAVNTGFSSVQRYSGSMAMVSIDMRFRVDCDQYFYGSDCSAFCIARNDSTDGFFTCDPNDGSRICLPNYFGSDCRTFCQPSNDETGGNYTCDPNDGSRICMEGFTDPGNFCKESEP